MSQAADENSVPIGTCGQCQVNLAGGGTNQCDRASTSREQCPLSNSCPLLGPNPGLQLVCCKSGECVEDGGEDDDGDPIPGAGCSN